jgi:hypothetical protein
MRAAYPLRDRRSGPGRRAGTARGGDPPGAPGAMRIRPVALVVRAITDESRRRTSGNAPAPSSAR